MRKQGKCPCFPESSPQRVSLFLEPGEIECALINNLEELIALSVFHQVRIETGEQNVARKIEEMTAFTSCKLA